MMIFLNNDQLFISYYPLYINKEKDSPLKYVLFFHTSTYTVSQGITQWWFSSVEFSHSVVSDSMWPHELQHARPPCPSPTPGVYPSSCPSSQCHNWVLFLLWLHPFFLELFLHWSPVAYWALTNLGSSFFSDAMKVLHSISQQIWKTQQWPQD